jgi:hypothetical protein
LNIMIKLFILSILLVSLALLCVCDGTSVTPTETNEGYYLSGAIIKNIDLDQLSVLVTLKRNDSVMTNATLFIGDDTLIYGSGQYSKTFADISDLAVGDHVLKLYDTTFFIDSVMFSIASDFEITSKIPAGDAPLTPGNTVQIEWSIPSNIDGYVYSAVKVDETYSEDGYSAFVTSGVTSTTFNSDAFALPSGELDTGWYYIYVYGYIDSPSPSDNIPTLFPNGLANSISKDGFTAKFGSLVITERDSIHAATQ